MRKKLVLKKTSASIMDTFMADAMCPSLVRCLLYWESTRRSKERQGITLGVHLVQVSILYRFDCLAEVIYFYFILDPCSESGSQSNEPAVTTASVTTTESPTVTQTAPVSPNKVKKESSSEGAPTPPTPAAPAAQTTADMNGTTTTTPSTPLLANVTAASGDAASPRKKPRKQNV